MNDPLIKLDFDSRLEVRINNQKPVVLTDLTLALLAVGHQFERFIESETDEQHQAGSELYIKEVRSGSIVVELIAQAVPVLPLLWQGGSLSEWLSQAKAMIEWLGDKISSPPKEVAVQDLKQWNSILEPVAKDHGSQMNFTVSNGGVVINQFFIDSAQANAAQNAITRELAKLKEPNDNIHRKRVMFWSQTKFGTGTSTGDRAVIESITTNPVKVVFENNAVKAAMLCGDPRFHKQWHQLAYLVDVSVQTVRDVPKLYTVTHYYPEDTFDPAEG